jgi:Ni,Fe-hydrogenase III large subunit
VNALRALGNAAAIPLDTVPVLEPDALRIAIITAIDAGQRVCAMFGRSVATGVELVAVLADDRAGMLYAARAMVTDSWASLTNACPQVHMFERELAEQWGVTITDHPWLKPVRFQPRIRGGAASPIGMTEFFRIDGDEVHEVGVGPVHAGVIEPGHFRFQCHGEQVLHLEISLGYQHRGVERALSRGPDKRSIHYVETLAGDTTIGHTSAYCDVVEALAGARPPPRAYAIRALALELERLANHAGDLGALANDVGFLPTASYCGRLRGDYLNLTAALCGSRFGRGLVRPGGVDFDLEPARITDIHDRLGAAARDTTESAGLLWTTASVMARFEDTGRITAETARSIGLVGPAARACGLRRDIRKTHPSGIYQLVHVPISTVESGDVFARAYVRWLEIERSIEYAREQIHELPRGPIRRPLGPLRGDMLAVALVEGWRGEICHVAITDGDGRFAAYKVTDPSFHNWTALALAMREQQISDFPLCNKSFNLSYCGTDL